jgi:hypothetical protein
LGEIFSIKTPIRQEKEKTAGVINLVKGDLKI